MATTSTIKPCDICGDIGVMEAIVICCECKVAREHLYCMRVLRMDIPDWWCCEECEQSKLVSPKITDNEPKTRKLASLMQQTTLVIDGQNKNRIPRQFNFKEKWVDKGRTKYLSCDEAVKLSSGSMKLNNFTKEFRSAHGMSKSMTPPRVFQQSTGLREKATPSTFERTPIKSPQEERSFKRNLQQPVVQRSFGPKERATVSTCERTPIRSPQKKRSVKPNLQQPVVRQPFGPKEKAIVSTCERTPIKSPQEERSLKSNLQQPVVQQSFGPKEKAIKSPQDERNIKPNLQQPVVQQSFGPKEKTTPSGCEITYINSPQEERNTKTNLQQPVQQSFSPKGNATQSVDSSIPSRRVEGTNPESEMKTKKNELLPPQKEADISRLTEEVPIFLKKHEKTETVSGCKNHADVEAGRSDAGKPKPISGLLVSEMHDPYIPSLNFYWKGCFYLPNGPQKFNEAFKAHPPSKTHYKVYETTKKLPENIYFELVSNHEIRTEIFPADRGDIGLYFFPMSEMRSENEIPIIDFIWRNNLVMKSNVDGLELFVLSSRVLPSHAQEYQGNYFLWGVFRRPKTAKKVTDKRPLMEATCEPCDDDVPPGFKRICKR